METFYRGKMKFDWLIYLTMCIVIVFCSCDSNIHEPNDKRSEIETLIMKNWQFGVIEINGQIIRRVLPGFDPKPSKSSSGWIPWFWFSYNKDFSYEFRSDTYRYPLGEKGNYQPEYGYWELNDEQNLLIHNKGMPYEKRYTIIEISDSIFIREHEHIIYQSFDTVLWPIGEIATYREVLEIREGP